MQSLARPQRRETFSRAKRSEHPGLDSAGMPRRGVYDAIIVLDASNKRVQDAAGIGRQPSPSRLSDP